MKIIKGFQTEICKRSIFTPVNDDDDELKFNDASTHGVILRLEGYTAL